MGDRFVGSDYLYDMPSRIGVKVEVVKSDEHPIAVDEKTLENIISKVFLKWHCS